MILWTITKNINNILNLKIINLAIMNKRCHVLSSIGEESSLFQQILLIFVAKKEKSKLG